ncbi:AAA family ATPase [Cellulosilyticum sp. ST5]|uniref:AAA family ATPase n=1 Tax=Cellulosilyticum sp. ST5 TaxID=3055805 RepID=UPI003977ABC9
MGVAVLLIGKSGQGKSTSLRNFGEEEISLINVSKKPLPFQKKFKKTIETDDYNKIHQLLDKSSSDSIVIDDASYLITNMFMNKHSTAGAGNAVFALYNNLGDEFWRLIEHIKALPPQKVVYVIMHEDRSDFGEIKPKTIGKLLDDKVCIEGMFTVVLRCMADKGRHFFRTQTDGMDVAKSPFGMFEQFEIDNDLKLVDQTIRAYWGI